MTVAAVEEHTPLAGLTTYRLGGKARYLAQVEDERALEALAASVGGRLEDGLAVMVLGRGSNVVISDAGFPGLVVRLVGTFREVQVEDGLVRAGGAASLPIVARTAARAGWGGLEFFVGIPGSVGGAVRMNAGCHGSETVDRLLGVRTVGLGSGSTEERSPQSLDLRYRHSNLAPDQVVVEARFATVARAPAEAEGVIREITRWRREHQPGGTLNAGSVFRNPPGDAAGRIIDGLGLKGFRVGGAVVSAKHANFFVVEAGGTAQDVYDLVWAVRRRVGEETGVWLEPEVQFAGPFRASPDEETP